MRKIGIREFKEGLSRFLKEVKGGQVIFLTDHGRVIAEVRPAAWPAGNDEAARADRIRRLEEAGFIRPVTRPGALRGMKGFKGLGLPREYVERLLDESRGES